MAVGGGGGSTGLRGRRVMLGGPGEEGTCE